MPVNREFGCPKRPLLRARAGNSACELSVTKPPDPRNVGVICRSYTRLSCPSYRAELSQEMSPRCEEAASSDAAK